MSQIEPPPNAVNSFIHIWKEWLNRLWIFIQDHTGGASPVSPATGTSWNAHGNTATGSANTTGSNTGCLIVDQGTFIVGNTTANGYSGLEPDIDQSGSYMTFIPNKVGAFRCGWVSGAQWTTVGIGSLGIGPNTTAETLAATAIGIGASVTSGNYGTAIGQSAATTGTSATAIGKFATAAGTTSLALGSASTANNLNSNAIGTSCTASGDRATAVGYVTTASGDNSSAVGYESTATTNKSVSIGAQVSVSGQRAIALGGGVLSSTTYMNNPTDDSMYIGVGSTLPTLRLQGQKCAIVGDTDFAPVSTLDVGGSVGYKYRIVDDGDSPVTLSDELTVIVDNSAGAVTLNLPNTSGIDRRIYHIKRAFSGGGSVKLYADTGEYIDGVLADSTTAGFTISAQDAPMLLCDNTSTNTGWWIL